MPFLTSMFSYSIAMTAPTQPEKKNSQTQCRSWRSSITPRTTDV